MTREPAASEQPGSARPGAEQLTYEQARAALEDVVRRLEAGGVALEESLSLWERGEELAAVCQDRLDGARARLDAAMAARDSAAEG